MTPAALSTALLSSFIGSLFLLQWWQRPEYPLMLWIGLIVIAIVGLIMIRRNVNHTDHIVYSRTHGPSTPLRASGVLLSIAAGIMLALFTVSRISGALPTTSVAHLADNRFVTLHGFVTDRPDVRSDRILYAVAVDHITVKDGTKREATGNVLVTDKRRWPRLLYGQEASISGILSLPDEKWYADYLRLSQTEALLQTTLITPLSGRNGSTVMRGLIWLRDTFEQRIDQLFPEPSSSLLAGLLTGARRGLPTDVSEAFRRTGLTHIIAVSGTNITIILAVIGGMLFFLPVKKRFLPSIIAITLFSTFVGGSASVIRACIMGILGLLALQTERISNARLTILWTAAVMLLWNPLSLWYDAGFQLSFLAVIGLTECRPFLEKPMQYVTQTLGIREALMATLSAQITAVPWILYRFELLSVVSPLANILVAPLVPLAMLLGFIATIVGFLNVTLGRIAGFAASGVLDGIVWIARTLSDLPGSAIETPWVSAWMIAGYYFILFLILSIPTLKRNSVKEA